MGKRRKNKQKSPGKEPLDLEKTKKVIKQLKEKERNILNQQNNLLRKIANLQDDLWAEYGLGISKTAKHLEIMLNELHNLQDSVLHPSLSS